jgi:hypothetical protein
MNYSKFSNTKDKWILVADLSAPVVFISSVWNCWKRHLRAKTNAGSPMTYLGGDGLSVVIQFT